MSTLAGPRLDDSTIDELSDCFQRLSLSAQLPDNQSEASYDPELPDNQSEISDDPYEWVDSGDDTASVLSTESDWSDLSDLSEKSVDPADF